MRLDTEILTSQGLCKLILKRVLYEQKDAIEASLWRSSGFLGSEITLFSAAVFLYWNGRSYTIIRRKLTDYSNNYWLELENLISCTIITNE